MVYFNACNTNSALPPCITNAGTYFLFEAVLNFISYPKSISAFEYQARCLVLLLRLCRLDLFAWDRTTDHPF